MTRIPLALSFLFLSTAAWCAPFQNGDFEAGGGLCNAYGILSGNNFTAGWTVSIGNIDWEGSPACDGWAPSSGNRSLDLVGDTIGVGGVQQTFDTMPGVTYQVLFDLAGNYGGLPVIKPLAVTINGVTTNYTFDTTGKSASNMGWTTKSQTFTATTSSSTINFVSDVRGLGGSNNAGAALDNVRIVALTAFAVPLDWAALAAALALAVAGLLMHARRRT